MANSALGIGSIFAFTMQETQRAAGSGYDLVHASGTLTLSTGTTEGTRITIRVTSLNTGGTTGATRGFDSSKNYSFVLVQADGGISGCNPTEFVVDTNFF